MEKIFQENGVEVETVVVGNKPVRGCVACGGCASKQKQMCIRDRNDIEQATKLARAMITRYGMSDRFGMVALETQNNPYLGGDSSLSCSPQTAADIDQMVVDTVKHGYDTAMDLLEKNQKKLHELAKYLYEKETITGEEFMQILTRTETLEAVSYTHL